MKVTIEGSLEQISQALVPPKRGAYKIKGAPRKNESRIAKQNRILAGEHTVLIKAFKFVRNDPEEKHLADIFLAAIREPLRRTKAVIESARQVINERP